MPPDDPALRMIADYVVDFEAMFLVELISEMYEVLDSIPQAVALAAPQIGTPLRVVVYDLNSDDRGVLINPRITARSHKTRTVTEGCLTYPDEFWRVRRSPSVVAEWQDRFGRQHEGSWYGLGAQMVQHELDHLEGRLIPDYAIRKVFPGSH